MEPQSKKILASFLIIQALFAIVYWLFPAKDPRESLWKNLENRKFTCTLIEFEPNVSTKDLRTLATLNGNYKVGLWHTIYSDSENVLSYSLRDTQNVQITLLDPRTNTIKAIAASSALVQELFLLYQPLNWKVSCHSAF